MLNTTPQWVAIYTRARAEKQVAERLRQQGFEVFLPIVERRRIWSDRVKMIAEPLFHSYLFVRMTSTQVEPVRSTDGVSYIVRRDDHQPIPDNQIEAIRRFVEAKQELFVHDTLALRKGVEATITGGAFEGLQGTLISDCKDGNFAVRINAIGLSLVTTIDHLLLSPVTGDR